MPGSAGMPESHRHAATGEAGGGLAAQRLVERHQHMKVRRPAHRARNCSDSHTSNQRDHENGILA